jgi:uncharacterized membrane protein YeaQ/YmgE (transglycosylase-associated protein family)
MDIVHIIILLIVAAICGSIGAAIGGGSRGGCLMSIVLGFIGALAGSFIQQKAGLPEPLEISGFPVVWSIIGCALFVAIINFISRGRRRD